MLRKHHTGAVYFVYIGRHIIFYRHAALSGLHYVHFGCDYIECQQ